jgi:hypothetical protein
MAIAKTYYTIINPNSIRIKTGFVASPGELFVGNNGYFKSDRYWIPTPPDSPAPIGISHLLNEVQPSDHDYNRIYNKVKDKVIGPKGELLTSVVEWRTSLDMITNRVVQLSKAYSAVKRFQFRKAGILLGLTRKQHKTVNGKIVKLRSRNELSPTSAWLEFWMGWAPLHGDITHALNTLVSPPPQSEHFSVGTRLSRSPVTQKVVDTYEDWQTTVVVEGSFSAYGGFRVVNHNLFTLNQLGLINPPLTVWQMIPFSFIADWFVNVGTVIGSLTDFVGLEFTNTGYAMRASVVATGKRHKIEWDPTNTYYTEPKRWLHYYGETSGRGDYRRRSPGPIQAPRLEFVMLDKLSLTRAATSISLLVEIFLKK